MPIVLIVDDDKAFCDALAGSFESRGWRALTAGSVSQAKALLKEQPGYAVVDLRLAEESGLALVPDLKQVLPDIRILVLTGYASIATAVEAIKLGAVNFLAKPVDTDEIIAGFEHEAGKPDAAAPGRPMSVRRMTWEYVQKVLSDNNGNISATARALGMHRRSLQRFLAKRPVRR